VGSVNKLRDIFGTQLIRNISPSLISGYQKKRLDEKSYRRHPTKPATVNREIACLRTMFNKAIRDDKLDRNQQEGLNRSKRIMRENVSYHLKIGKDIKPIVQPGIFPLL